MRRSAAIEAGIDPTQSLRFLEYRQYVPDLYGMTLLATRRLVESEPELSAAGTKVLADPKVLTRLEEFGFVTDKLSPAEFTALVTKQVADFQPAVKASGAKLN